MTYAQVTIDILLSTASLSCMALGSDSRFHGENQFYLSHLHMFLYKSP